MIPGKGWLLLRGVPSRRCGTRNDALHRCAARASRHHGRPSTEKMDEIKRSNNLLCNHNGLEQKMGQGIPRNADAFQRASKVLEGRTISGNSSQAIPSIHQYNDSKQSLVPFDRGFMVQMWVRERDTG